MIKTFGHGIRLCNMVCEGNRFAEIPAALRQEIRVQKWVEQLRLPGVGKWGDEDFNSEGEKNPSLIPANSRLFEFTL